MYELNPVDEIGKAKKNLEKMKKYEQSIKLHEARIDDKTIVYCKNEDRIEKYKKLK
jgi:hypothetical protein